MPKFSHVQEGGRARGRVADEGNPPAGRAFSKKTCIGPCGPKQVGGGVRGSETPPPPRQIALEACGEALAQEKNRPDSYSPNEIDRLIVLQECE